MLFRSSIYKLKRCSAGEFLRGHRLCLNYHIEECRGICGGTTDRDEYMRSIDAITEFLSGKEKPLINDLRRRMKDAAAELRFEDAARYRDNIKAAEELAQAQRVTMIGAGDLDVVLAAKDEESSFIWLELDNLYLM